MLVLLVSLVTPASGSSSVSDMTANKRGVIRALGGTRGPQTYSDGKAGRRFLLMCLILFQVISCRVGLFSACLHQQQMRCASPAKPFPIQTRKRLCFSLNKAYMVCGFFVFFCNLRKPFSVRRGSEFQPCNGVCSKQV